MAKEENLNLIQKLAKIRKIADMAVKDKRGFNYSYADLTEILAKVTAGMEKYGVSLIPEIVPETAEVTQNVVINTKFDKTGKPYEQTVTEMLVKADMMFTWVNDDNPEDTIEVPWIVTGSQGDPSQALGSGLTYCTRYFMTNYFQIPQVSADDVDAFRSKKKEAEVAEDKALAEEIISRFDVMLREYLADHPDKSDEVRKFLSRFAKNANYRAIKEPVLASKLLKDFTDTYINATNNKEEK